MNLVGFHEAGKTSLAKRLLGDEFDIKVESTEGIALHYIESKFNRDTERGESWVKSELTADKVHEQVKAKIASELENLNQQQTANMTMSTSQLMILVAMMMMVMKMMVMIVVMIVVMIILNFRQRKHLQCQGSLLKKRKL